MDWLTNLTGDIENLMRSHGQQRTVNANGQNINVTTVQGQTGNTSITIANIDNLQNVEGEINDDEWEDQDDEVPQLEGIQTIQLDIEVNEDDLMQNL